MEENKLDEEILAEAVRKWPFLYDKRDKRHQNRDAAAKAWTEISKELCEGSIRQKMFCCKKNGSGGIRTHASEETGALNQRLRPLGHATSHCVKSSFSTIGKFSPAWTPSLYSSVAERWSCKPKVMSSILIGGSYFGP